MIEIQYFDVHFIISNGYRRDILTDNYRAKVKAAIYADGDFDLIEMYEIMMMPVIQSVTIGKQKKSIIWLRYFCLSCVGRSLFLHHFTGNEWKFYIVKV